jgi:hypothetical protein
VNPSSGSNEHAFTAQMAIFPPPVARTPAGTYRKGLELDRFHDDTGIWDRILR